MDYQLIKLTINHSCSHENTTKTTLTSDCTHL